MPVLFPDTTPDAERILITLLRQASPRRKIQMLGQMNQTARGLALAGLKQRHPGADPEELHRRLAELLFGPETAVHIHSPVKTSAEEPMLSEQIQATLPVVKTLENLEVPYLIGGSFAGAVHGVVRTTLDTDIIAELRAEHIHPLVTSLQPAYYIDENAVREAVRRRSSFNLIHQETMFKVDIFVSPGRPFDKAQFLRRVAITPAPDQEETIYTASPEDTILSKLEWYRQGGEVSERQWRDVLGILAVQADRLDFAYLRKWAANLGVADLLEKAIDQVNPNDD